LVVPRLKNVVVPELDWYGTDPVAPPAKLVAVPIETAEGADHVGAVPVEVKTYPLVPMLSWDKVEPDA
jgi:hypothetical protein